MWGLGVGQVVPKCPAGCYVTEHPGHAMLNAHSWVGCVACDDVAGPTADRPSYALDAGTGMRSPSVPVHASTSASATVDMRVVVGTGGRGGETM